MLPVPVCCHVADLAAAAAAAAAAASAEGGKSKMSRSHFVTQAD